MTAATVFLCAIVGALIASEPAAALTESFLLVPVPLNVTVGAVAEFSCRADADVVSLTVNDIAVNRLNDPNITSVEGPVVDGFRTEILRIVPDVQHNNSVIHCVSITFGEKRSEGETFRELSAPALLMVQGRLSAPTNMQASQPNESAIHLCWDPPFTLDITNVTLDIPCYTVSITNTNTSVTSERNVTEPEFLFQEEGYDPCHVYLFEVSAWNPVGVGNTSDVMNKCFGDAPQSANVTWTMRDLPAERISTLHLIITYDMSCHGRRPKDVDIIIITTDGSRMRMNPPTLSDTGRLVRELNFSVDNAPCGVQVTVTNQFGNALTEIMIDENCQLISTEDVTEESSQENNLVIPVVVGGIGGAILVIVVVAILIVIFVKFRGERDVDIEDFAAKDNQYTDVPTKANIAHNTGRQTRLHNSEIQTSSHNTEWQSSHSPSASSTDSQTPLFPNRMETDSQSPVVPNREAAASQPPTVPSRKATASQEKSELQYAEIAIPQQQQQQAPLIPQRVAYALLKPQDTKASTEHES